MRNFRNILKAMFVIPVFLIAGCLSQQNKDVTGITINSTATITKGQSLMLTATITPADAENKAITWSSANTAVATVANGIVTGVSAGSTTITAAASGKQASCTLTVTNPAVTNILGNGTFDSPLSNAVPDGNGTMNTDSSWVFLKNGSATGTAEIKDGILTVKPTNVSGAPAYGLQIIQAPVKIEQAGTYKLTFDAKGESAKSITVKIGADGTGGWMAYKEQSVSITASMATYTVEFTMSKSTDEKTRVEFWISPSNDSSAVTLDNVILEKTAQGTVPSVPVPGTKTEADADLLETWQLAWSDEFDGNSVDETKWGYNIGNGGTALPGWGNAERECYTNDPKNVYIQKDGSNSYLAITAIKEDVVEAETGKTLNYSSGKLTTKGKYDTKYGKIEVRAKLPEGKGIWPAIWMLGSDIDTVTWPKCGEIDIMELLGHEPWKVYGTPHGTMSGGSGISGNSYIIPNAKTGAKFSDDFHRFTVEWDENRMKFFVDDVLFKVVDKKKVDYDFGTSEWVYDHNFYMILNVAVGGGWPGDPDSTTVFPQTMLVDYVRVYENKGTTIPAGEYDWTNSGYVPNEGPGPVVNIDETNGGMVLDNTFVNTAANWVYGGYDSGAADVTFASGTAKASIANVGTSDWNVQLKTKNYLNLENGKDYVIKFKAKSTVNRNIKVVAGENGGGWKRYKEEVVALTDTLTDYTVKFTMTENTNPAAELIFMLGNVDSAAASDVEISGVYMSIDGGMINDPAFLNAPDYWVSGGYEGGGGASFDFAGGKAVATIPSVGSADWNVQLKTKNYINLENGKTYEVKFKAKSSAARNIKLIAGENGGGWKRYKEEVIALTDTLTDYTVSFTMNENTNPAAELIFALGKIDGAIDGHTVEISGASMKVLP